MRNFKKLAFICICLFAGTQLFAQDIRIGGAVVDANANLAETLNRSNEHLQFVQVLKSSGVMEQLDGKGPYSVFALTDDALKAMPAMDAAAMEKFVKSHIVAQKLGKKEIATLLKANNNSVSLTTLANTTISLVLEGEKLIISGTNIAPELVIISGVEVSNGIINVTDHSL